MALGYRPGDIDTVNNCKICNGRGETLAKSDRKLPGKRPGTEVSYMVSKLCICKKNLMVERKFKCLHPATIGTVSDKKCKDIHKEYGIRKSRVFTGSEFAFFRIVKSMFVNYVTSADMIFHMSTGLEIIQDYYVEQKDGSRRDMSDLIYNRDLVVIMFTTNAANKALQPVMLDLIQGRVRIGKPVWIWTPTDIRTSGEWTETLQDFIDQSSSFAKPIHLRDPRNKARSEGESNALNNARNILK